MRIERLVEENPRTQGAARRAWYRAHSPEHLRAVARLVEEGLATRGAEAPDAAAVLGAGACTELPLERLARACSRVALADLDVRGMERARQELPPALRGRVELVTADLTGGVSASLAAALRAQPWADLVALSEASVLGAAASCLEALAVPSPPRIAGLGPEPYGLVISSLTLTQLFSLPLLDVVDTLAVVAPRVRAPEADARYHAAARGLRRRIALAHLDLMASLLAPEGAAVLISDETGYLLAPTGERHGEQAREALPLLSGVLDLSADLAGRFTLLGPWRRWEWQVSQPTPSQPGRAYAVIGVLLRAPDLTRG
jgi:hypothetical protein